MDVHFSLIAPASLLEQARMMAESNGGEASEAEPADMSGSLNAGIGITAEEFKAGVEIVTVIFKAGAAAFTFLKAMRDYLRSQPATAAAVVTSPRTGEPAGVVRSTSTDAELQAMLAGQ